MGRGVQRIEGYVRRFTGWPRSTAIYPWPARRRSALPSGAVVPSGAVGPAGADGSIDAGPPLNAVLATWNEADVIEATVANAFAQGCQRVLLIDNDSDDETVELAVKAGAELMRSFRTDRYEERERIHLMNEVVGEVSAAEDHPQLWWLYLDADELPTGRRGLTIRQHLALLDPRFRVVGAHFLDHYPTDAIANLPGFHPIDLQPACDRMFLPACFLGHYKHPLLRIDGGAAPGADAQQPVAGLGFHTLASSTPRWAEPVEPILVHHFPFRDEAVTRERLRRVNERSRLSAPTQERAAYVDAIYRGDWSSVRLHRGRTGDYPVKLADWRSVVPAADRDVPRWYETTELEAALAARRGRPERA